MLVLNKKGEMGIGTLIIFIAMILVAAIAASVLIQTATSLQNKALLTGKRTQGQISTAAQILLIYGEDGTTAGLDKFFLKMKLAPGSDTIRFNDTLIELDLTNSSADLTYNQSDASCADGTYATVGSDGNFSVKYLISGTEHRDGYLHPGDVALICLATPHSISSDEDIAFRMIPKVGVPTVVETAVPDIVGQKRIYIFP